MNIKFLILIAFLAIAAQPVQAAQLSDEALASYIEGRIDSTLNSDDMIAQNCSPGGCAVIVQ